MKVLIELPPEFDVKSVDYNEESRTLTVEPRIRQTSGHTTVGYIKVVGSSGREQRSVLRVALDTGTTHIQNIKDEVSAKFDSDTAPAESDEGG